jgi:hypothetical protein
MVHILISYMIYMLYSQTLEGIRHGISGILCSSIVCCLLCSNQLFDCFLAFFETSRAWWTMFPNENNDFLIAWIKCLHTWRCWLWTSHSSPEMLGSFNLPCFIENLTKIGYQNLLSPIESNPDIAICRMISYCMYFVGKWYSWSYSWQIFGQSCYFPVVGRLRNYEDAFTLEVTLFISFSCNILVYYISLCPISSYITQ